MTPRFKRYQEVESWVFKAAKEAIRARLEAATEAENQDIKMAIMCRIAIGDPDFEAAFPEFAHANPGNHKWTAYSFINPDPAVLAEL